MFAATGNWLFLYVAVGVLLSEPLFSAANDTGELLTLLACFDHDCTSESVPKLLLYPL